MLLLLLDTQGVSTTSVSYATLEEISAALGISLSESSEATIIALAARASRAIDSYLKRAPGAFAAESSSIRYFSGDGSRRLMIDEIVGPPVSVEISSDGLLTSYDTTLSDYLCWPYNAESWEIPYVALDLGPLSTTRWPSYPKSIRITGVFGFSSVEPDEIKQATIIQAIRWFKRGQQAFQDTGAIVSLGQLIYTQQLDPEVKQLLSAPKFQRITL